MDTDATLTIEQVADRYQTSKDTVYRWLRGKNDFPRPMRLPTRGLRWTADQLRAWDADQVERANRRAPQPA